MNALTSAPVSLSPPPETNAMTGTSPGAAAQLARLTPAGRTLAAQRADVLGAISQGLAGRPYGERALILAHMAPKLAALGVPTALLARFDPTDTNLAAVSAEAGEVRRAAQAA
jgi:hypothetical protein